MKISRILICGAIAAAALTACSKSETASTEVAEVAPMTVDSLLASVASLQGDTVTVEGFCSHICRHGGKKAFLLSADSTQMLMCIADAALPGGAFAPDCPGKTISVTGVVTPMLAGKADLEARAAAEAQADAEGHCDTEKRANGTAAQWLDSLNRQITAGGDTVLTVGYYISATSYAVPQ